MRVGSLTVFGLALMVAVSDGSAEAGLLGAIRPPGPTPIVVPNRASPPPAAPTPPAAAIPVAGIIPLSKPTVAETPKPRAPAPPLPPISPRDLHVRVLPAVVALVVSGGKAPASVATGVLITASGLMLTSRHAIAESIDGNASVAMVRGGAHGRLGAHELNDAVATRLVGFSDELDLALVEALPSNSIFYPHLPIVRHAAPGGATVLAVGHADKRGLWSAMTTTLGAGRAASGPARWLRALPPDAATVAPGTPLCDAVGRIVAVAVDGPAGLGPVAVDAEGLLRFLLAADAPDLRFAGVPPFRRPPPGATRAALAHARPLGRGEAEPERDGLVGAQAAALVMPNVTGKGTLDHRAAAPPIPAPPTATAAKKSGATEISFASSNALHVSPTELERHPVPATIKVEARDLPERGPHRAPVTIVELGDYHAPQTRDAESAIRSLVEGDDASARLLWKDGDRGDGADYLAAARAAHAADEQDEFWSMHDRLLKSARPVNAKGVRQIARALDLNVSAFETAFSSDGLVGVIEGDGDKAGRIPALCTPAFVVNGRVVDGGSVAGPALREAVDEELAAAWRTAEGAHGASGAGLPRTGRLIAPGAPINGSDFNAAHMARAIAETTARRAGHPGTSASPRP